MTELTTTPASLGVTADEAFDSLTGFDEIAITKAFGKAITAMAGDKVEAFTWLRALAFVYCRRAGQTDADAYASAQGLTLRELTDYFAEDAADVDPEDPDTESGKGEPPTSN